MKLLLILSSMILFSTPGHSDPIDLTPQIYMSINTAYQYNLNKQNEIQNKHGAAAAAAAASSKKNKINPKNSASNEKQTSDAQSVRTTFTLVPARTRARAVSN